MKTENLSTTTIREALNIGGGLYRMNASESKGYAFCKNKRNRGVYGGGFMYPFEMERVTAENFDGYICFETKTLTDLASGEKIKLQ